MTVSDLIPQVHYATKGNTKVPTEGTDKYTLYLSIAQRKQREWATDPNNRWKSLYEERDIGTVSVNTQTYDLDDDFLAPSDQVFVDVSPTQTLNFDVIKPQQRSVFTPNTVFVAGALPQTLTFVDTISTGNQLIGGTIRVPAYYLPADFETSSDDVRVDNPDWLIYATAAELVRNDPSKADQFPNLVGLANDLYEKMVDANQSGAYLAPNSAAIDLPVTGESW